MSVSYNGVLINLPAMAKKASAEYAYEGPQTTGDIEAVPLPGKARLGLKKSSWEGARPLGPPSPQLAGRGGFLTKSAL